MSEVYLAHHGILGQKWGVRRYQNANGSLTLAGSKRYGGNTSAAKEGLKAAKKEYHDKLREAHRSGQHYKNYAMLHPIATSVKKGSDEYENNQQNGRKWISDMNSARHAKKAMIEAKQEVKDAKVKSKVDSKVLKKNKNEFGKALGSESKKVGNKMSEELKNSKEYKEFAAFDKKLANNAKKAAKNGEDYIVGRSTKEYYDSLQSKANAKSMAIANKYKETYAKANLKDLGIEVSDSNVKKAVKYMNKNM